MPDAIVANDDTEIVIVEGLYILHQMKPTWHKIQSLLDFGIFLSISESLCRRRLVDRKVIDLGGEKRINPPWIDICLRAPLDGNMSAYPLD